MIKKIPTFNNFVQLLEALPTDEACREYLEWSVWEGKPICPKCGSMNPDHYKLKVKGKFNGLYKCKDCRERFTVTVGTMFEGSHIGLRKWFIAMSLFINHKKGISSLQLSRDLGITQKSAWFMLHRIRQVFGVLPDGQFTGLVVADETWVGGADANKHRNKTSKVLGEPNFGKTLVLAILENEKTVHSEVINNRDRETIEPIIHEFVATDATLVTDEYKTYRQVGEPYKKHVRVNHGKGEYVKNGFHTNSLEGFFSHMKRGITGIYHQVSPKHLNRYCNEFAYRYNTRQMKDTERFCVSLRRPTERLMYKELINKA